MEEPKMQGIGSAFEYRVEKVNLEQDHNVHRVIRKFNTVGAEGWEVMFFHEGRVYMKRRIFTALEQKAMAEYNANVARLEEAHSKLVQAIHPVPKNVH